VVFSLYNKFINADLYPDEAFNYGPVRPEGVPPDRFLINLHSHSRGSDGLLTPHQLVKWHIANGYNGLVISDHNTSQNIEAVERAAKEIDPKFVVIPGIEFTAFKIHMNLIGVRECPWSRLNMSSKVSRIKAAIDFCHRKGGLVQYNHRGFYRNKTWPTYEQLYEWGIDGIEIFNGFNVKFVDQQAERFLEEINAKNEQSGNPRRLYKAAGVDLHDPCRELRVYTEPITEDVSVNGIIEALKKGNTRVWAPPDLIAEKNRFHPERPYRYGNPNYRQFQKRWLIFTWLGRFF
jgi:predicted metal-dependent phosphoesterase TrpH